VAIASSLLYPTPTMDKVKRHWQDFEWVLGLFDDRLGVARRRYKAFVAKGISEGRREDLTGGGLILKPLNFQKMAI